MDVARFARQTWTLTIKNLMIVFVRHWFSTTIRAVILPIVFMFFISYAKEFFIPPAQYGIGSPNPVRSLSQALNSGSLGGRDRVVFVHNGKTGGQISAAIDNLSATVTGAGHAVTVTDSPSNLAALCPSSLRGVTTCYGAVSFLSSPTEGGNWTYNIFQDGSLGTKLFVNQNNNDAEIFSLPLQRAVDQAITSISRSPTQIPDTVDEYPYTKETNAERQANITRLYQGTVISIIGVAFFIGIVGVSYQLVGHMAMEREIGMSQLIEAMMPNQRQWEKQAARLLANHLAFDILYAPGWIVMGVIVAELVFPNTSYAITIFAHVLVGLALASWSLIFGAFFHKAQLSGIVTVIAALVLAIAAQLGIGKNGSNGAVLATAVLFPPATYVYLLMDIAGFQQKDIPANLYRYPPTTSIKWKVTGITFIGLFIFQIIVFPFVAALVERELYGTTDSKRKISPGSTENGSIAVSLNSFSKHYTTGFFKRNILCCGRRKYKNVVRAVSDLTLQIRQGQIVILLGANGSGKSTTLDAISGLSSITHGSIDVNGSLGLCPQKNVLWDELTVYEHAKIFDRLKTPGKKASKEELYQLIEACDLDVKTNALSGSLSGGQKRKCQLICCFVGGSQIVAVDEVSSGIDPLARRKIWDILLNERGQRTILLTTHFLDEADVLSDHIAMLSKGILKAEGSSVELKHQYGGGYKVAVESVALYGLSSTFEKVPHHIDYDQTVFELPDSRQTSQLLITLESHNINQYQVHGPTVEDVFLRMADEIKKDFEEIDTVIVPPKSEIDSSTPTSSTSIDAPPKRKALDLITGQGTGPFRQTYILFQKRFVVIQRNYLPHLAACLVALATAGLVPLFLKNFTALTCNPATNQINQNEINSFSTSYLADIIAGPASALARVLPVLGSRANQTTVHLVNTIDEFNAYINANYSVVQPGGFFIPSDGTPPIMAYVGEQSLATAVLVQNVLDSILSSSFITTAYQTFALPFAPEAGNTLQLILYFGLAMSAYPGFFALYPTNERLRKVRALHYSNGIRSGPIWTAYVLFDFIWVLFISIVAIGLFVGQWYGWYQPGYLFLIFILYGLTSIVWSYVVSLFTTSTLAAFAFSAGVQCLLFLIYFIAYLAILTYAPVNRIDDSITIAHFTISLVSPSANLARALLVTLNEFSLNCRDYSYITYPGGILVYGGPILYLIVQFILLFSYLVWYDGGGRLKLGFFGLFTKKTAIADEFEEATEQDIEVVEELDRIKSSNDGLRVMHLSKTFGSNTAVEDVNFGIRKSEVFALLGPNGAGKSTTISLIRGDLKPTGKEGDVWIEGIQFSKDRDGARNHLGVCPQFDAMDTMTVAQQLRFYAKCRGVADPEHNVNQLMSAVGLTQYKDRLAQKLSGGNKRKTSLAIALMGNPSVLLLDEPSSGMDAAAKRVMWRVLGAVSHGRALLITTHSMEEADALSHRAGIMARRMLAIGTTEFLRKRHGDAYHVHLVHKEAPYTSFAEMERVKTWVATRIPAATVEPRTYHGQLRFTVPSSSLVGRASPEPSSEVSSVTKSSTDDETIAPEASRQGISALFALLEANQEDLGFAYYSVSPTTLDGVFLSVINKHNIAEENSHPEKQKRSVVQRVFRR